jgi:hypothetical protein
MVTGAKKWFVAPSSNLKNGTEWRDILEDSEFGPMYVGEAFESNARLMAAAPDLLAIAQAAASHLPEGHQKQGWLAVIANATGGAA